MARQATPDDDNDDDDDDDDEEDEESDIEPVGDGALWRR